MKFGAQSGRWCGDFGPSGEAALRRDEGRPGGLGGTSSGGLRPLVPHILLCRWRRLHAQPFSAISRRSKRTEHPFALHALRPLTDAGVHVLGGLPAMPEIQDLPDMPTPGGITSSRLHLQSRSPATIADVAFDSLCADAAPLAHYRRADDRPARRRVCAHRTGCIETAKPLLARQNSSRCRCSEFRRRPDISSAKRVLARRCGNSTSGTWPCAAIGLMGCGAVHCSWPTGHCMLWAVLWPQASRRL